MHKLLLVLLSPWIFLRFYVRDAVDLVRMCKKALHSSRPRETEDTILIVSLMVVVLMASPAILLYTSYHKVKRTLSIYGSKSRSA